MEDRSKEQNTQSCAVHADCTSEELLDLIGSPTIQEQQLHVDFSVVKYKAAESVAENSSNNAWNVNVSNGNINWNNNKTNTNRVRPCLSCEANNSIIFDIPFSSIVLAFYDCEIKKKSTNSYQRFHMHKEESLVVLWQSIVYGQYETSMATVFIIEYPVLREVFAAAFVDRVVHHYICMRINPLFESMFEQMGNVSMNCRKGYGQFVAQERVKKMMYNVSEGYTKDCWIYKGDIKSFFMSIDRDILWSLLEPFIRANYKGDDLECLIYLMRITLYDNPINNCRKLSAPELWEALPKNKSSFFAPKGKSLQIGRFPSQLEANFYAAVMDWFIMYILGFKDYVRFVDDFVIMSQNRELLISADKKIDAFLREKLLIQLHPMKKYFQHYTKGVLFVGAMILPGRTYISNRTRAHLIDTIYKYNKLLKEGKGEKNAEHFVQSLNSFFGMMRHHNSYGVRRQAVNKIDRGWFQYFYIQGHFEVFKLKKQYKPVEQVRQTMRKCGSAVFLDQLMLGIA